ncbi:glycoside hydrolase superfamily [Exophiala viscosa]|uniref:Glycoside hydrolase superfamily n=1 Tax=Exophiala viscosa TaxID=2486360 RepID=A0AAN6DYJ4_9EURO|nr:glycoside hydrolase superfamily [Exophiala viscosa]
MTWWFWRKRGLASVVAAQAKRRRRWWPTLKAPLILLIVTFAGLYLSARIVWRRGGVPANLSVYPDPQSIKASVVKSIDPDKPLCHPLLRARGRDIVDKNGDRIKLISANWYGGSDMSMVSGGLDVRNRSGIARTIRELGFNSVRLPYADEIVQDNPVIEASLLSANDDLVGERALDVYAAVVQALTEAGLAVIVNNHITQARWCCDGYPCDMGWANDNLGPFCPVKQSEDDWIENLMAVMLPHVNNTYVVGVDLRNEVRGPTGRYMWNSWATAAERAAARLHELQSDWLIIVEGVSSANDIRGAEERPVRLQHQDKLVYSAHVYGWSGWGSLLPYWYRTYKSFAEDMDKNWQYLRASDTAPVWIGEIGAPGRPARKDFHYWKNLMRYLQETDVDIGYWAINPRKPKNNEYESYGLLEDDWETPRYDYRLMDLTSLRRQ